MTGDVRHTLLTPFERNAIPIPHSGERWAFLNAMPLPPGHVLTSVDLLAEQRMRGSYMQLEDAGKSAEPRLQADDLDGCLVLCTRSRRLNEITLARAWAMVRSGGPIVVAGDNKAGAKSLRKWASQYATIEGNFSKHHAQAFWLRRSSADWPIPEQIVTAEGFAIPVGSFSAGRIDTGSRILSDYVANEDCANLTGRVADFGAGWGFLSERMLHHMPGLEKIDLYEADFLSLEAARENIDDPRAQFHWTDLTREPPTGPFDLVIMNPPFHESRAAEPSLGIRFIEAAAQALAPGGRLLMVANTQLPYERTMDERFRSFQKLEQRDGFKILEARR